MMLAQFEKLTKHSATLTTELDSTPPGTQLIKKLADLKETLGHVEATVKLMSEMADVFARFAEAQTIGPAHIRLPEADYRRLAGLEPGMSNTLPEANHPPYYDDILERQRIDQLQRAGKDKNIDQTVDAVNRAMRVGPVGRTILPGPLDDFKHRPTLEQRREMIRKQQESQHEANQELADFHKELAEPVGADEEEGEDEVLTVDISVEKVALVAESKPLSVDVPDEVAKGWFKFEG